MPTTVDVPDVGSIDFPDEMSIDDISKAIRTNYPPERFHKWVVQDTLSRLGKSTAEQGAQALQGVVRGAEIAKAQQIPSNLQALAMQAAMEGADVSPIAPLIEKAKREAPVLAHRATPENPFYQFGRDIEESAGQFYQPNPQYDQSVRANLIQGAASTVPVLASGPLAPLTYAGMMGEQGAREAEAKGASPEKVADTFLANAALGVTSEYLLGVPYLLRSMKAVKGVAAEVSKSALGKRLAALTAKHPVASLAARGAVAEAIQEGPIEQTGQNAIAKFVGQYDPERPIFQDVAEQAAYGGAIGLLLGGLFGGAAKIDKARSEERAAFAQPEGEFTFQDPVTKQWLNAADYAARKGLNPEQAQLIANRRPAPQMPFMEVNPETVNIQADRIAAQIQREEQNAIDLREQQVRDLAERRRIAAQLQTEGDNRNIPPEKPAGGTISSSRDQLRESGKVTPEAPSSADVVTPPNIISRGRFRPATTQQTVRPAFVQPVSESQQRTRDALRDLVDREKKRILDEERGQMVLDEAEAAGRTPDQILKDFWSSTWGKLSENEKKQITPFLLAQSGGFKPGDVIGTKPGEGGTRVPWVAKQWSDVVDLDANEIHQLQGSTRGLASLMEFANRKYAQPTPTVTTPPTIAQESPPVFKQSLTTEAPAPVEETTIFDPSSIPVEQVSVASISLSKDAPNFKAEANPETGVVTGERLEGDFSKLPDNPVTLWRRLDGRLEIITGRHRLDLAKRSAVKNITAQVVNEADGFTKEMAMAFDAAANIRDEKGTIQDYADFFRHAKNISEAEAQQRGLLSRAKGRAGWDIGRLASDDLYALYKSGKISETQAIAIVRAATNPEGQRIGARYALNGKTPEFISGVLKASQAEASQRGQTLDLFGADDQAMNEMEARAERAATFQREIQQQIRAVQGAAKNPTAAAKLGVDVRDPEGVLHLIEQLRTELERWENWPLHPELVARVSTAEPLRLEQPESVADQKSRLAREEVDRKAKEARGKVAEGAVKPLTGTTGDLGQGDLLGGGDLFSPSTPTKPTGLLADLEASMTPEERAELATLEAELRKKLGRTNIAVDPTLVTTGGRIAFLYAKAGVRQFRDFATRMLAKFGEDGRQYLMTWYNNARMQMGGEGWNNEVEAQQIYDTEFAGSTESGRAVSEAVGGGGAKRSPIARVVRRELIPRPRTYVRTDSYSAKSGFTLGEEQTEGINQAVTHFLDRAGRAFVIADGTGFGKTAQLLGIVDQFQKARPGARILFVTQNQQMIKGSITGDSRAMGIELDGITLTTYSKLHSLTQRDFDLVVFDECFVAGTQITMRDGTKKSIQDIRVGEWVQTATGFGLVKSVMKRVTRSLVKVTTADNGEFVCTQNHPFFTNKGWIRAGQLNQTHYLKNHEETMRLVHNGISAKEQPEAAFLRNILRGEMEVDSTGNQSAALFGTGASENIGSLQGYTRRRESTCVGKFKAHDGKKSDAIPRSSESRFTNAKKAQASAKASRRQWHRTNESRGDFVKSISNRSLQFCSVSAKSGEGLSHQLQDRRGLSIDETRNRMRRAVTRDADSTISRSEKRSQTSGIRVVSCETVEQKDFYRYGGSDCGVEVFNLEVGNHPSYALANGAVVHNCHNLKNGEARKSMAAARVRAAHKLFSTATPMDKPSGAAYFLSEITGKDEVEVAGELGYTFQQRIDPYTQEPHTYAVLKPGFSWQKVWANIIAYRDAAIRGGAMLRREYPFYGQVNVQALPMDRRAKMEQETIERHYDRLIDSANMPSARRNYSGQKTLTLRRWAEQQKVEEAFRQALDHVNSGGHVIIMAETDKPQSFPVTVKGSVIGQNEKGRTIWRAPGAIEQLAALFENAGITVAHIHDTTRYNVADEVDKFQTGRAPVALATPQSGGAGINLDDVVGDKPRLLEILSKNLAGDLWDQVLGRVSRKTTQSEARVEVLSMPDSYGDQRADDILDKKIRTLRAIQGGEDLDTAAGFEAEQLHEYETRHAGLYKAEYADLFDLQHRIEEAEQFGGKAPDELIQERNDAIQRLDEFDKLYKQSGDILATDSAETAIGKAFRKNPKAGLGEAWFEATKQRQLALRNAPFTTPGKEPSKKHTEREIYGIPTSVSPSSETPLETRGQAPAEGGLQQPPAERTVSVKTGQGALPDIANSLVEHHAELKAQYDKAEAKLLMLQAQNQVKPHDVSEVQYLAGKMTGLEMSHADLVARMKKRETDPTAFANALVDQYAKLKFALDKAEAKVKFLNRQNQVKLHDSAEVQYLSGQMASLRQTHSEAIVFTETQHAAPQQGASTVKPSDIANKIADSLENIKSGTRPGDVQLFGVIPSVWDTAVSIAQAIIRAGGRVADAVAAAISHIRANHIGAWDEAGATSALNVAAVSEPTRQISGERVDENLGQLADELGTIRPADDEEGVPTKVGNVHDQVLSRPGLNNAVREDSVNHAQNALAEAGLVVARADDGLFELADNIAPQEEGGQNLIHILEREIQAARNENRPERIANLLNTVVVHLARDKNTAFSQATRNRLYALAQGERSSFGRALGGLAMWGKVLANVAQNPSLHLNRIYSENLGGDEISEVLERLHKILGANPTEKDIEDALTKVQAEFSKKNRLFEKGNKLWTKIQKAARAGLFDPGPILEGIAREQGWTVPTEGQKDWLRAQVAEEERLLTPTQRQIDAAGGDIDKATVVAAKDTESDRLKIIKEIQANWSRWSQPVSWNPFKWTPQVRRNNARAVNEFVAANFLFTPGFPVRQWMDVILTSLPLNAVNRTLVHALERAENAGGFSADSINDIYAATREMVVSRIASLKATLRAMERTASGHLNRKVLDRMTHSIGVFERMRVKADALEAAGNRAGALAIRFATILQAGYRVASVFDESQATGVEWQEMRQQLSTDLRAQGKTRAEIAMQLDDILGGIRVDMAEAVAEVTLGKQERGLPLNKKAIEQDAWGLIKARSYDRMRLATGTATDYEAENTQLRELHSWNLPETGGIGGAIAGTIKFIKGYTEKAGIPTAGLFSFGNAMGIAANRMATFSGGGLFGGFGFGDSPWYQGERNIRQRRIEAVEGLAVMGLLVALAAAGKILIMTRYPDDKDEKERFIAEGHKLNTIRFIQDDGKWLEYPIQMSPFSFIASPLYMIGGIQRLLMNQQKAQERLNAEAAKTGATPGKAKEIGPGDVLGVIAQGMYGMLTGGRTASGAVQSFADYGDFNLNRATSSLIRGYLPGIPAWQQVSRMMGVAIDSRTGSLFEQLVPVPGSQHQRVNSLGDPMTNANDGVRVLQVLTGGLGFGSESDKNNDYAYRQLAAAGYAAPAIGRGKGYNFGGTIRPLNPKEYERYAIERGKAFRQELEALGSLDGMDSADARKAAQGAFHRANQRALASVGVSEIKPKRAYTRRLRSVGGITRRGRTTGLGVLRRGRSPSFGKLRQARGPRLKRAVLSGSRKQRVQRIVPANY